MQDKIDFKLLERYHPPVLETFFVCMVRSLQLMCLLGSFVLAIDNLYTQWTDAWWCPFAIFAAHVASFYRGLWLEEKFRPNHIAVQIAELVVLTILIRLVALLFGFTDDIANFSFMIDLLLISAAYLFGRSWARNYYYLFVQPFEIVEENHDFLKIIDNERLTYDHAKAYTDLKAAWYWMMGLQCGLVVVAISLANYYGTKTPLADFRLTMMVYTIIHLFLGLPLQAWLRLRFLRTGWRVNRMEEPLRLRTRWGFYLLGLGAVTVVVAIIMAFGASSGVIKMPDIVFSNLPQGPTPTPEPLPTTRPRPTLPPIADVPLGENPLLGLLGAIWTAFSFIFVVLLVTTLIYLGLQVLIKAGWVGPSLAKLNIKDMWKQFADWVKSLFGPKRQRDLLDKEEGNNAGSRFNPLRRFFRERLPGDPRGQVRFQFRRMAERANKVGIRRSTGQTPDEYSNQIGKKMESPELQPDLDNLTDLYEEARYSHHPIDLTQANAARLSADKLSAQLRQETRRLKEEAEIANKPPPKPKTVPIATPETKSDKIFDKLDD